MVSLGPVFGNVTAARYSRGGRVRFTVVELEVGEQLEMLCDTRLEGGEEGFDSAVAEMSRERLEALLGEAVDALLDAQTQHEREMRRLAQRLQP
jgi:hypothetical protein